MGEAGNQGADDQSARVDVDESESPGKLPCWIVVSAEVAFAGMDGYGEINDGRDRADQGDESRDGDQAGAMRSAPQKGEQAAQQKRIELEWREAVEQLGVEHPGRRVVRGDDPKQWNNDDRDSANPAQHPHGPDMEDDPRPEEVELLLDAERPEVAQKK